MLEAYGSLDQIMRYYGTPDSPGGHFPFNFRLISDVDSSSTAEDFRRVINEYLERITEGRTANWVVSRGTLSRRMPSSGIKTPVRTSQETHYFSGTESSRSMLCKM
jgi:hypothetical protein